VCVASVNALALKVSITGYSLLLSASAAARAAPRPGAPERGCRRWSRWWPSGHGRAQAARGSKWCVGTNGAPACRRPSDGRGPLGALHACGASISRT
jgi:hypothetical protein